jgi:hypothetical protein
MLGGYAAAAETVDLELVLLADASRSIDDAEIRFQRQGYAGAITAPDPRSRYLRLADQDGWPGFPGR